jgi:hypothetical protein
MVDFGDVAQVLGRVATGVYDTPRGPDVVHRIAVKRSWIERGEVIELTLPRNLSCAACAGGGCDRCARSGAITLRQRGELEEVLTVPLPKRSAEELQRDSTVVLRVPEQGGFPEPGQELPRGFLLLRILASNKTDAGIRRLRGSLLSLPPGAPPSRELKVHAPEPPARWRWPRLGVALVLMVAFVALALLLILRAHHGH